LFNEKQRKRKRDRKANNVIEESIFTRFLMEEKQETREREKEEKSY
jgi:hypothetical protein